MPRLNSRGFTLIEALVALVVLSVGLLGATALLLDSLGSHARAQRQSAGLNLVRDVAERVRANLAAGAAYDTRFAATASACTADCDSAALAAADRDYFASTARQLFPARALATEILFEPAIGTSTPGRFTIALRLPAWSGSGDSEDVVLTVLAWAPVAGGA